MAFFKKLFGTKKIEQTVDSPSLTNTDEQAREPGSKTIIQSIYPYFKQFTPSNTDGDSEKLPDDLSTIDKTKAYSFPSLIVKNICDDLFCMYAIDNEMGLEMIQERYLEELGITREELHTIAMSNYRRLLAERLKVHNNSETFMFILDANLEAGLVLVDEVWDQVEDYLKEDIVICVPSRDVIIATGKSKSLVIAEFSEKAKTILLTGDHPLSKNWFVRENKNWKVFQKIID